MSHEISFKRCEAVSSKVTANEKSIAVSGELKEQKMNIARKIIEAHKLKFGSLPPLHQTDVRRSFSVGDWVVYKPFENCREADVSDKGKIIEDFGDGMYRVTFGYTSIHGTRTGNFNWSNLWAV